MDPLCAFSRGSRCYYLFNYSSEEKRKLKNEDSMMTGNLAYDLPGYVLLGVVVSCLIYIIIIWNQKEEKNTSSSDKDNK